MTATGEDLLRQAEDQARQLAHQRVRVETVHWEQFDTTAYRLLGEVIGPAPLASASYTRDRASLLRVLKDYPAPLRPPLDTTVNLTQAARLMSCSPDTVLKLIEAGQLAGERGKDGWIIPTAELDRRTDIDAPDAADPHPLRRLSATTLGALADLVSHERRNPRPVEQLDDTTGRDVTTRVLSVAAVAARYALAHGKLDAGDRPLAIAQYALRAVDSLGPAPDHRSLVGLAAVSPGAGNEWGDRLDCALHDWAVAAGHELDRTIPATQVMANIANLGTIIYAATHKLNSGSAHKDPAALRALADQLRPAAAALQTAEQAWKSVTTLQPQTQEFGQASYDLFAMLREAIQKPPPSLTRAADGRDIERALDSLRRAAINLSQFLDHSHDATRACLNSGLLFAPARILPRDPIRADDRLHRRWVSLQPDGKPDLLATTSAAAIRSRELAIRVGGPVMEPIQLQ
jgi:hypothetical protein